METPLSAYSLAIQLDQFGDDKNEQLQQVFKFVKNIWPKYDGNGNGKLSYDEAKPFINEVVGPMIGRDQVYAKDPEEESDDEESEDEEGKSKDLFSEKEYTQIYAQIDIINKGQIAKAETAQFLVYLAKNKEIIKEKAHYL